ncbi:MAG: putative dehydrogenase [Ilumatobacteraceae bacterium]|nr:putative dehydrogenase [Ilumatobacteraceae bacterium]
METEHLSYCRICAAACGVVVTIDAQRVVKVRGDMEHPVSRGYVCSKGRGMAEWHHRADRLDRPRMRGAATSWSELLDDLAGGLRSIIDGPGASAIGLYLATGLAYDSGGQVAAGMWMRTIGSGSFYTAATVDNAPILVAAELVTGNPMLNPVWNPEDPGLLVLVGTNPVVSHGYGTTLPDPVRRYRDYRRAGGRIWVLDPRRTESAALADEHVPVRPGSDVAVLAAIANELLRDGADPTELCRPDDLAALRVVLAPFTLARAATVADVAVESLERLLADIRERPGRLAVFCGTGTTMAADGVLVEWLRWVLLVLTGSLDRAGGMRFNRGVVNRPQPPHPGASAPAALRPASRPELPRIAGQIPSVALADEIEAGNLRALVVTGGNPLSAFPEPDRLRAALLTLDVLAVIDVADTELTEIATHVLPATGQLERADLSLAEHVSIRSGMQFTPAVLEPVADRRPVWWMLAGISTRLGTPLMGITDPDALTDETFLGGLLGHTELGAAAVLAAGPRGIDAPIEFGWVRETMLPDGCWRIAPPSMLERLAAHRTPEAPMAGSLRMVPRREMAWSNSIRFAGHDGRPDVRLHPADATAAGLVDGEPAVMTSDHGSIDATVRIDDTVRLGVASLTHGHRGATPGRLTSSHTDVDPLTSMPLASGVPVTVSPGTVRASA